MGVVTGKEEKRGESQRYKHISVIWKKGDRILSGVWIQGRVNCGQKTFLRAARGVSAVNMAFARRL